MQEVKIENNDLGLKVFVNGVPKLSLAPKEEIESVATVLELQMTEFYKNKDEQ